MVNILHQTTLQQRYWTLHSLTVFKQYHLATYTICQTL